MKKFLPYILIGVVMAGLFSPISQVKAQVVGTCTILYGTEFISLNLTEAQCAAQNGTWSPPPPGTTLVGESPPASAGTNNWQQGLEGFSCSIFSWDGIEACVAYGVYYLFFMPTASVLWFSGQILDVSASFSLNGAIFKAPMIDSGWVISRDLANLFFIFVLLYIAIATILQLSGYGAKQLLVRIIIIALLVNFSLVITRVIIDASNILALGFYDRISTTTSTVNVPFFDKQIDVKGIAGIFMSGFDPQRMMGTESFEKWQDETGGDIIVLIIIFGVASIVNLIASFILFAGALLFIIRIAVLWILMILAPLAFLFMVLPKTQQYANDWWNKLFNQAFFAPAFMFLFYMVAVIVGSGFLRNMGEILEDITAVSQSGLEKFLASIGTVLISFTVLTVLMITCLIVAQKMGAWGAGAVMGWGKGINKGINKAAKGYAGRIGKRYIGRTAAAAEGALEKGTGKFAATLRATPFLQRGLAAGAQLKKKEVKAYEKKYTEYYDEETQGRTLEQLKGKLGTTREAREAIEIIFKKKRKQEKRKKEIEELDKTIAEGNSTQGLSAALKKRELLQTEREEQFEEKEKEVAEKEESLKGKEVVPEKKEEPKKTT